MLDIDIANTIEILNSSEFINDYNFILNYSFKHLAFFVLGSENLIESSWSLQEISKKVPIEDVISNIISARFRDYIINGEASLEQCRSFAIYFIDFIFLAICIDKLEKYYIDFPLFNKYFIDSGSCYVSRNSISISFTPNLTVRLRIDLIGLPNITTIKFRAEGNDLLAPVSTENIRPKDLKKAFEDLKIYFVK